MGLYSQRHYEDIARTLREVKASQLVSVRADTLHAWEATVRMFADRFQRDNESFKRDLFYKACAYEGTEPQVATGAYGAIGATGATGATGARGARWRP